MKKSLEGFLTAAALSVTLALAAPALSAPTDDLVAKGEYLVRAGSCAGCHTAPGGKPFAGGLYMPTPFGNISTPNITPDNDTGIGAWTDEQFYRAMHEGVGAKGEYLYPVFPFPWYTKVNKDDVAAIKAYLFSLKAESAPRKPLQLSFPANVRTTLLSWRTAFFKAGEFAPDKNKSPELNRGEYLVTGLGHCGECHNRSKISGVSNWSGTLQGGVIEGWYAPNLTSDKHEGIGSWSKEDLAKYLKTGAVQGRGVAVGPMAEVVNDSLKYLKDEDLSAMATYLKSVKAEPGYTPERVGPEDLKKTAGADAYVTFCSSCHQNDGNGIKGQIPGLANNGSVKAGGPENVIRVVLGGLEARGGYAPMPAIGAGMTDQQVADAANYVRQAWGNNAPAGAGAGKVADLRKNTTTLLNGAKGECKSAVDVPMAKQIRQEALAELGDVNLVNVMTKIDELLPKLRAKEPSASDDAIVNGMIAAYCPIVLKDTKVPEAQRIAQLGNFGSLVYGRLKNGAKQN